MNKEQFLEEFKVGTEVVWVEDKCKGQVIRTDQVEGYAVVKFEDGCEDSYTFFDKRVCNGSIVAK